VLRTGKKLAPLFEILSAVHTHTHTQKNKSWGGLYAVSHSHRRFLQTSSCRVSSTDVRYYLF